MVGRDSLRRLAGVVHVGPLPGMGNYIPNWDVLDGFIHIIG